MSVPSGGSAVVGARCVAHPGRLAAGGCPRCGRARCAADAAGFGRAGCAVCVASQGAAAHPAQPMRPAEVYARAGLAAWTLALAGAAVGYNYVQAQFFSLIVPALVGFLCASVATRFARSSSQPVRLLAAGYAAASALLAFRFAAVPFGPVGRWLPPALAAAAVAWLGSFPPRKRKMSAGPG